MKRLLVFSLTALLGFAAAQGVSGSLRIDALGAYMRPAGIFSFEPVFAAELRADDSWGRWLASLAVYPSWRPASGKVDCGLSEVALRYGSDEYSFGVGLSPRPLTVARLLRPFALTARRGDYEPGVPGAWAEFYPDANTRLSLAGLWVAARPLALLQVEGAFAGVDYGLHAALAPAPAPLDFGVEASGRLGDFVVYAEVGNSPRLGSPWRFVTGASFYLFSGLLVLEGGWVGGWRGAASYSYLFSDELGLEFYGRVSRVMGYTRPEAQLLLTYGGENGDLVLGLAYARVPGGALWQPSLSARSYF